MKTTLRQRLLTSTLLIGVASVATPAYAQDGQATTTAEETGDQEAIVITGTLITNPNLVSSSPVNVVGEEEIELQQANVAEELLRELPGAVPSIGSAVNNGNGGSSFVNLRNLGSNRNVVLLDGVRLSPVDLLGRFDLNNVPLALIQRVDVLTGGASTTYGADAVSGVVNFITRQDFAGIDINLSEQITEQGDGNVFRADVTIGANFDDGRGNAVLSVGYQEADAVYQGARYFSLFAISSATGARGGSGTSVPTSFTGVNPTGADQITSGCGTAGLPACVTNAQGTRQSNGAGGFNPSVVPFNFNPYNIYQTPFQRFNIYGAARYEISDAIEVYTRGIFSKNTVNTIVAPSGSFGISVVLPLNNPFLSTAQRNAFCNFDTNSGPGFTPTFTAAECAAAANPNLQPGDAAYRQVTVNLSRRALEVGPRVSEFTTTFFDYRAGARGGITDTINWDLWGSYGESENVQATQGYTLNSRIRQSLLTGPGGTACRDTSNGCVPINFFGPAGSITPEGADFLSESSTIRTVSSLAQARATINGDFGWTIPWASDAVSFAIGGEFRQYRASQVSDSLAQSGDLGGFGGAPQNIDGGFNVYEAFGELIIPLVQDRPFFDELLLEGGIRYSSYSVDAPNNPSFNTTTWKVGGSWAPFDGLRFRGNYARAVRAPNINELFAPVTTTLTNLSNDPCASLDDNQAPIPGRPIPSGELRAICIAQGAPAGQIGAIQQPTSGQANSTGGGNLNLNPEKASSWTVGAVFQPNFIPGLSLSVDYYSIKIRDAITAPTPGDAIEACFGPANAQGNYTPAAGAAATQACTQIRRNGATGQLSGDPADTPGLFLTTSNLGRLETSGIDFTANYQRDLGFAGLNLNFVLNWTEQSKFQAVDGVGVNRDCVGFYSANCLQPIPEWQWSQRTTLTFGDIDVSLLWRHISGTRYEEGLGDLFAGTLPNTLAPGLAGREVDFNRIKAYDYFDLTTRFAVNDNLTVTLSVQNLFDKEPPIVGGEAGSTTFNSGGTFPSTYDSLGRRFVASARIRF
jgi:outer membrane receptor protein involved in Fe transport